MIKLFKTTAAASIAVYAILCCTPPQDCSAQNLKSEGKPAQGYFDVVNDFRYYEIKYDQNDKEYLAYYQALRKRIIRKLKSNYNYYFSNGDVNLLFLLNSDGSLARLGVDSSRSTDDKKLVDIAVLSLKQASPFPPFPKEFNLSQMPFSVIVSFKEKGE